MDNEWIEARDLHGRLICLVNVVTGEMHIRKAGRDYLICLRNGLVVTILIEKKTDKRRYATHSTVHPNTLQPEQRVVLD